MFLGLPDDGPEPRLELTCNFGRDEPYELGNGYGHIAITSPDLDATLARLGALGIEPERPPYTISEGGSRLCSYAIRTGTGSRYWNVPAL